MHNIRSKGAFLIAQEREEQIVKHGFDAKRDAAYVEGELVNAALHTAAYTGTEPADPYREFWPPTWGTRLKARIENKPCVQRLVIAGALIAAEIDRIIDEELRTLKRIMIGIGYVYSDGDMCFYPWGAHNTHGITLDIVRLAYSKRPTDLVGWLRDKGVEIVNVSPIILAQAMHEASLAPDADPSEVPPL